MNRFEIRDPSLAALLNFAEPRPVEVRGDGGTTDLIDQDPSAR
jgi:hypothetical protein